MTRSNGCRNTTVWMALAGSVVATFCVFVIPLNRYNWDGRSAARPDADDVLAIVLFSLTGVITAAVAAWAALAAARRVRTAVLWIAAAIAAYDILRLLQALPHYRG